MNMNNMNMKGLNGLLQQYSSNPLFQQAQNMSKGQSPESLKQIAMNICQEKGINFNEAYAAFQNQMKMKGM